MKEYSPNGKKEQRTEAFNQGKIQGKAEGITQGITQGIIKGEQNIILELLNNYSIEEVSEMINKDESKIQKIIGID